jgi:hypothetical protein
MAEKVAHVGAENNHHVIRIGLHPLPTTIDVAMYISQTPLKTAGPLHGTMCSRTTI